MKYRQAVIAICDFSGVKVKKAIMYRQPFNKLGLEFSFSFNKTYGQITTTVDLKIFNPSPETIELFVFNPKNLNNRPMVRIYAGYSDFVCRHYDDWAKLKNTLPLIFSGYPYYLNERVLANGKELNIMLTDKMSLSTEQRKRFIGYFPQGATVFAILEAIKANADFICDLSQVDFLRSIKIENPLMFAGQDILAYILPLLGKKYNFTFSTNENGTLVFKPTANLNNKRTNITEITNENGLIEIPERQNWAQWEVKTFFGLPHIFSVGEWVTVKSEALKGYGVSHRGELTGLITEASYNFAENAYISYIISTDGTVSGSTIPIIEA